MKTLIFCLVAGTLIGCQTAPKPVTMKPIMWQCAELCERKHKDYYAQGIGINAKYPKCVCGDLKEVRTELKEWKKP